MGTFISRSIALVDARVRKSAQSELLKTVVCREPLFLYPVVAAGRARSIEEVLLLSNDSALTELATRKNIRCLHVEVFPEDTVISGIETFAEVLKMLAERGEINEGVVVGLSAWYPLISPEDVDKAVQELSVGDDDCIFSAVELDFSRVHSQPGRPPGVGKAMLETGALFAVRQHTKVSDGKKLTGRPYFLPAAHSFRVSTPEDVEFATAVLQRRPASQQFFFEAVDALVLDFDGVFTDNKVTLTADGLESAVCDRSDGFAIQSLKRSGLPLLVLSTEKVPIVRFRCEKLGLECIHGVPDKLPVLKCWLEANKINPMRTVYVGNDVNDVGCMNYVGYPVAVADAYPEARSAARLVLSSEGGSGAVREIATLIANTLQRTRAVQL